MWFSELFILAASGGRGDDTVTSCELSGHKMASRVLLLPTICAAILERLKSPICLFEEFRLGFALMIADSRNSLFLFVGIPECSTVAADHAGV